MKRVFFLGLFVLVLIISLLFISGCINNSPDEDFCGFSTLGECNSDDECQTGGCSGQICYSTNEEEPISTCEFRTCYDPTKYNLECKCIKSQCKWK